MNNTTPVRQIDTIVRDVAKVITDTNPMGVAVEPIATMMDPRDDLDGDYTIRASYMSELMSEMDQSKRYCVIFEASFTMATFMHMKPDNYEYNLKRLANEAILFRDQPKGDRPQVVVTADKVMNIGDVVNCAHRTVQ